MATVLGPTEERIILRDVSWETYESLLADHQDRSVTRFAYDRGAPEIRRPSAEHEEANDLIKLLVNVLAEEMNPDIKGFGSTTFKRADLSRRFTLRLNVLLVSDLGSVARPSTAHSPDLSC